MATGLFTHELCARHQMGESHPESPQRLASIFDFLRASGLFSELVQHEAPVVEREALLRAHPEHYLAMLERLLPQQGLAWADPDTALNEFTLDAAARAAGAATAAVRAVMSGSLTNAFCAVRPPGHHAEHARVMGFCFHNNVAVGVHEALAAGLVTRCVPRAALADTVESLARRLAGFEPAVLRAAKRALHEGADLPLPQALRLEARLAAVHAT